MSTKESIVTGTLYIVPTPIGNLEDITLRALRILKEVDFIAAEDTRHTRRLLNHFEISTPLTSYYREKENEKSEEILAQVKNGSSVALVSDAGTPGISDPGAVIVSKAHEMGIPVVPLPGASALITALSACGFADTGFLFFGFLPARSGQRLKMLASLAECEFPVVFYESPHRIDKMLADAHSVFGNRKAFWARELTKNFEDLQRANLADLAEHAAQNRNRGEFVIIVWPGEKTAVQGETVEELVVWYRDNSDLSLKDVAKKIASDLGISRSKIYQQALTLWNK